MNAWVLGRSAGLLLSLAAMFFLTLVGLAVLSPAQFGFAPDSVQQTAPSAPPISPAFAVGGLTILGIAASLAVSTLRAARPNEPLDFKAFGRSLLYPQTFIALCLSPVVLFGAMIALDGKELGPALYLAAFQNGFFWQRVLDSKAP